MSAVGHGRTSSRLLHNPSSGRMNAILRRRIRSTVTFVILGAIAGLLIGLVVSRLDEAIVFWGSVRGICIGILIGLFLGAGEEFMVPRLSRKLSFLMLNLTRVLSYAAITLMALVLVNAFAFSWASGRTLGDAATLYLSDGSTVRDLVVAIIAAITLTSALQVRRLHNKGEIKRLLTGKYYYPQEESRVFLFADLASSTTHAERLGPLSYSMMLRISSPTYRKPSSPGMVRCISTPGTRSSSAGRWSGGYETPHVSSASSRWSPPSRSALTSIESATNSSPSSAVPSTADRW